MGNGLLQALKENGSFVGVCLIAVVVILAARLILHFAGVELSDTLSDVFNWAEAVAVAAMAFFYLRWRQRVRGK